jgi:hypothetical protein
MLAITILARESGEHRARLKKGLAELENSRALWVTLRALQVVQVPGFVEAILDIIRTTQEVAVIYDGLLVLHTQAYDPKQSREWIRDAFRGEAALGRFLWAAKGSTETNMARFAWLLRESGDPEIPDLLRSRLLDRDPETADTARRLLKYFGYADPAVIPVGTATSM